MMIIVGDMNVGGISQNGYMGSPALPSWLIPPTSFQARMYLVSAVFGFSAAGILTMTDKSRQVLCLICLCCKAIFLCVDI